MQFWTVYAVKHQELMVPCCSGANLPWPSLAPTFDKRQGMLETFRCRCSAKRTKKVGLWCADFLPCSLCGFHCPSGPEKLCETLMSLL